MAGFGKPSSLSLSLFLRTATGGMSVVTVALRETDPPTQSPLACLLRLRSSDRSLVRSVFRRQFETHLDGRVRAFFRLTDPSASVSRGSVRELISSHSHSLSGTVPTATFISTVSVRARSLSSDSDESSTFHHVFSLSLSFLPSSFASFGSSQSAARLECVFCL